jgi:hypothetical protein
MNITDTVLAAIKANPGPTSVELAESTGIEKHKIRRCLSNLVCEHRLYSTGPLSSRRYHLPRGSAMRQQFVEVKGRDLPVRNSLMPNGSPEYWRQFLAEVNTPARADAGSISPRAKP